MKPKRLTLPLIKTYSAAKLSRKYVTTACYRLSVIQTAFLTIKCKKYSRMRRVAEGIESIMLH